MRAIGLVVLVACGAPAKEPVSRRPLPAYHIAAAADVRWPVERTLFVGTLHQAGAHVLLRLDADPAGPSPRPRLIALRGGGGEIGARAAVSGNGRAVDREEAAAGAVIAIDDVQHEHDIAAPHLRTLPIVRIEAELSVALAKTFVTAEGVVVARGDDLLLALPSRDHVRLRVVACDETAAAQVGKHHHVYGRLTDVDEPADPDVAPTFAISQPVFEDQWRNTPQLVVPVNGCE